MNKNRPPRRGWQAAALGLAAVLGGCEAAARLEDLVRWGIPLGHPAARRGDIVARGPEGMHGRPSTMIQGWAMNSQGTRGPEFAVPRPPGTWRIVVAGASEMFGLTEPPGREFARQLEDSLRAACPARAVEVVNTALPGMTLPTAARDLSTRVARFEPDVVLYGTTPAQYLADSLPRPAAPAAALVPLPRVRSRAWPRFVSALRAAVPEPVTSWATERAWQRAGRRHGSGWRFESLPGERLAAFEADLRGLVGSARSTGAAVVLLPHAHALGRPPGRERDRLLAAWRRFTPRATGPTLLAFDSAAAEVSRQVAADSGVAWIDPRPVLGRDPGAHFTDFAHFTDLGAARLAGLVGRSLAPRGGC